ncbi:MAG: hypothetical protein VCB26_10045, partial [Candidatus Hydrogenedentota bacterium]
MYSAIDEDRLQKAKRLSSKGEFSESQSILNVLDSVLPGSHYIASIRATNLHGLGNTDEAVSQCTIALGNISNMRDRFGPLASMLSQAQIEGLESSLKKEELDVQ